MKRPGRRLPSTPYVRPSAAPQLRLDPRCAADYHHEHGRLSLVFALVRAQQLEFVRSSPPPGHVLEGSYSEGPTRSPMGRKATPFHRPYFKHSAAWVDSVGLAITLEGRPCNLTFHECAMLAFDPPCPVQAAIDKSMPCQVRGESRLRPFAEPPRRDRRARALPGQPPSHRDTTLLATPPAASKGAAALPS